MARRFRRYRVQSFGVGPQSLKILLDTHFVLWATIDPSRLTGIERVLMEDEGTVLHCSTVSLWELRLKWHRFTPQGRRKGPADPSSVLRYAQGVGWTIIDLTPDHAVTLLDVPLDHADPFDELLLVQAQVEGLRLLTRDGKLIDHPLAHRQI